MSRLSKFNPWQRSIRAKLLAGVLLAALAPLLLVAFTSYREQRRIAVEEAFTRLEGIAAAQVGQLERVVGSDEEVAGLVTSNAALRATLTGQNTGAELDAGLDQVMQEIPRLTAISVLDTDGNIIATTDLAAAVRASEAGLELEMTGAIQGVVVAGRGGEPVSLTCAPVIVDGVLVGAVMIETDITAVGNLATNYVGLSETGETSVAQLDENGSAEFIAPLRFKEDSVLSITVPSTATSAPITLALAGEEARFDDTVDYRGETVLAVTRQVEGSGWGVVVKIDEAEALAGTTSLRDALAGAWVLGSLLVILMGYFFARWVSRPVQEVKAAAEAVAAGNLDIRAETKRVDELGSLAAAVNVMTDSLVDAAQTEKERTVELETLNRQLGDSEERIRAIFESAAEGIVHCDERGMVLEFNLAAEEIFGRSAAETLGLPVGSVLGVVGATEARETVFDPMSVLFDQASQPGRGGTEMLARRPGGTLVPVVVSVSRVELGSTTSYTALIRDISERVAYEQRLSDMANQDGLTGLPNREQLTFHLKMALEACRPGEVGASVLFVDLDRFKLVNDAWGHASGDSLLRLVGERLSGALRSDDVLARFGGDEFVVLATDVPAQSTATALGRRLLAALEDPFELDGNTTYVSASIGIATTFDPEVTTDDLISQADVAMYRAKQAGRGRLEVFDSHMRSRVQAKHELDTELRKAIDAGQLDVHYQPIVAVGASEFCGLEALVRWTHPTRGAISPGEFIPAAEETGLIVPLGRFVLERACRQLAEWQHRHPSTRLQMAVNLSAREVMQSDCVELVRSTLAETGADPASLTIEVTESLLITDTTTAIDNLRRLRELGVKIALDDFGTGYSSLTYLRDMPVDIVKIDREFMGELEPGRGESTVVSLVLGLGERMGLIVVGEGIETQEQHDEFVRLGGRHAQGFLYARPQPAERVEALLWPVEAIDLESLEVEGA